MIKTILASFLIFLMIACGTQKQLQRSFVGKSVAELGEEFGPPKTVIDNNESKVYIFEQEKKLRSTEIDQGKLTLDPIITPKVIKTERYYFTVVNGVVKEARVEEEYER